jgi:acyl-CoA synthetase (AMP-forming)/AMP-acid ligase II
VDLAERIREVLALDPDADAIQYHGTWHPWRELAAVADAVTRALDASGCGADTRVGMLLRNHPAMVGAMLGVVSGRRCIVTVNPHQGDGKLAAELRTLALPVVIGLESELDRPGLAGVLGELAMTAIAVRGGLTDPASPVPGLDRRQRPGRHARRPGIAVEMLTSGTTGPPKRIPLAYEAFERTIGAAGQHYRQRGAASGDQPAGRTLRSGVAIISAPFVHMSGIFRTLLNVCEGRRVVLLDRFAVAEWVDAVREHRPRAVSLVPTALRMVLDAAVEPDDLSSIEVVTSGSAPLDPQVQRAFEDRYRIAVLPSYGATEFAGGVAGWTLPLHREWGARKLGSVGRPQPGRALRVVDETTGTALASGSVGLLEVGSVGGDDWVRTTDLARIDEDGFLWISGRADDAILRGGFKVFPSDIADVLRAHPAVRDCGVTGIADERLGAVPVAAVELADGATVTGEELLAHAREHLAAYQVPREIVVVRELPRTPSMKVSAPGVAALFEPAGIGTT